MFNRLPEMTLWSKVLRFVVGIGDCPYPVRAIETKKERTEDIVNIKHILPRKVYIK
jgi:hypothetical protein